MKKDFIMNKKSNPMLISLILILSAVILAGCNSTTIKIGWVESSGVSNQTASYESFKGTVEKTICIGPGETLTIEYQLVVDNGALELVLADPDDATVWETRAVQDNAGSATPPIQEAGCYTLQITGEDTGGSFDIRW
jgi:hypothetical protein